MQRLWESLPLAPLSPVSKRRHLVNSPPPRLLTYAVCGWPLWQIQLQNLELKIVRNPLWGLIIYSFSVILTNSFLLYYLFIGRSIGGPESSTPEYLSVPGFQNCLKNLDKPHHTQYCLPQTKPSECLDNSWKKLKTIFNSPCQGVGVSNYSSRSEAEAENSANLFSLTKIMILIPFLTKILLI